MPDDQLVQAKTGAKKLPLKFLSSIIHTTQPMEQVLKDNN